MGIRDDEIKRLIHYGTGLGVKVVIYNKTKKGDAANWSLDGTTIQVFAGPGTSKTEIVLHLIHELGHHVWFIHEKNRQQDLKFDEAITRENLSQEENDTPTPKHLRKKIYDVEVAGSQWWETIYKETDIKIPVWKLHAAMEVDMWMYEVYYETGKFPRGKFRKDHVQEVIRKHRPK